MKEQIEGITKILQYDDCIDVGINNCRKFNDCNICKATRLYNVGYRKQKEGEWVYRENEFGNAYYACSICDCQTRYKENYCSSCGAKMKGGAE